MSTPKTMDDLARKYADKPCEPAAREVHDVNQREAVVSMRRRRGAARVMLKEALRQSVPVLTVEGPYLDIATDALLARLLVDGWGLPGGEG